LREVQSAESRSAVARADVDSAQRARLPDSRQSGNRRVHGTTAAWHSEQAPVLSGRESLDTEAAQQRAVARYSHRLAEGMDWREGQVRTIASPPELRQTDRASERLRQPLVVQLRQAGSTALARQLQFVWPVSASIHRRSVR